MIRTHCDRCDIVINDETRAQDRIELPPSFLEEKGGAFGALRVTLTVEQTDGDGGWDRQVLCADCNALVVDRLCRAGAHDRLVRA